MNQIQSMKEKMVAFGKEYIKTHKQSQEQPKAKTEVKTIVKTTTTKEKKNPFIVKRK